jgi:hypothetical protein
VIPPTRFSDTLRWTVGNHRQWVGAAGVVGLATPSFTAASASAAHAPATQSFHENEAVLAITPLSFAGYFGPREGNPDGKVDVLSIFAAGFLAGYERHISPYFRFGPRFEYLFPFMSGTGANAELHELRGVVTAQGVFPLVDGALELSLGSELGAVGYVYVVEALSGAEARSGSVGFTAGGLVGLRGWFTANVAIALDLGSSVSPPSSEGSAGFRLRSLRIIKGSVGIAVGW